MPAWEVLFEVIAGAPPTEDLPFSWDEAIPRFAQALATAATETGVRPLSDYLFDDSVFESEIEQEVLRERFGESLEWQEIQEELAELAEVVMPDELMSRKLRRGPFFDASEGLAAVRALATYLTANPVLPVSRGKRPLTNENVLNGLDKFERAPDYAGRYRCRFRIRPS